MLLKGEIFGPMEIVSKDIAINGVKYAKKALKVIEDFLRGANAI